MVQAVIPTTVVGLQGRAVAATPAPTNNQALVWNGTAWVPGGPYLTAAGAPYIATNYVDNSGFVINQRGYSSGTALAAGAYGLDRWKAGASGCTLTFTSSPSSTVVTIAAGTLQQVIEGLSLINASYTLSWVGSATGRVNTGTYVASPITFTGAPNTNVTIEFQGGTLSQVQLQIGTQATLWQPNPIGIEFSRCQRFFWLNGGAIEGGFSSVATTVQLSQNLWFVQMRTTPTVTITPINLSGAATSVTLATANLFGWNILLNVSGSGIWYANYAISSSADL